MAVIMHVTSGIQVHINVTLCYTHVMRARSQEFQVIMVTMDKPSWAEALQSKVVYFEGFVDDATAKIQSVNLWGFSMDPPLMTQKVTELVSSGIMGIGEVKRHIHLYITKPIYETIYGQQRRH